MCRAYFTRPDLYGEATDPEGQVHNNRVRAENRLEEYQMYLRALLPRLPEAGIILDIGAGTGLMLSLFPKKYLTLAIEPNQPAAQIARSRGLTVVVDFVENLSPPETPPILIIFNQSLDHLINPNLILERSLNWLAPGGFILLTGLINPESLAARLTGPGFRLWHPFHQIYPTREAVLDKLGTLGFKTLAVWRPYFQTQYGSFPSLLKGAYILTKALCLRSRKIVLSPPWPGNVLSFLAQKITVPVKSLKPTPDSLPLGSGKASPLTLMKKQKLLF
jgi:SAM-dependent methyltransferase